MPMNDARKWIIDLNPERHVSLFDLFIEYKNTHTFTPQATGIQINTVMEHLCATTGRVTFFFSET